MGRKKAARPNARKGSPRRFLRFYEKSSKMSQSSYARKMARLSARIFGEIARPTAPKSTKVVRIFSEKPKHLDGRVVDYYPPYKDLGMLFQTLRSYGLYRDEHQDFKEEMKRLRALRGKTKCKKGEGKRAMKRQSEGSR